MPTFAASEKGYSNLWDKATVKPEHIAGALEICNKRIIPAKSRYLAVEKATGVPWWWIACTDTRESDNNPRTHLHNGDPLSGYTYHVPAGRPKVAHGPPFTWSESAIDAITMPPHNLALVKFWSVERGSFEWERYNGEGYIRQNENSPYVYGWTTEQEWGKYVSDGRYERGAWDNQAGTVALVKVLATLDADVAARLKLREAKAPPEVIKQQTTRERVVRNAGAGGAGATGAEKATTEAPTKHIVIYVLEWTAIGAFVALCLIGAVLVVKRTNFIKTKWG